jgi:hypothetical protein
LSSKVNISDFIPDLIIISETSFAHSITVDCFFAETLGILINC